MTHRPAVRELRRTTEGMLVGLAVGLAVVLPWTRPGYLMLLDWVSGPHATLNPGVYGLSGSSLDAMPFRVATQGLRALLGPATTAWVLLLAFFPVMAGGVAHLVRGSRWRTWPAALAAVLNPFVVERVGAGHVAFLLGCSLLPWLAASAEGARREGRWFSARSAGWYALAIAISPHAAWLGALVLVAGALLPRPRPRDLVRTVLVVLAAACVYTYAAVLWLTGTHTIAVTQADLEAYATRTGPGGIWVTVLSLHGYWRGGDGVPRTTLGLLGPVVLVVVLALVALGLSRAVRLRPALGLPWAALTLLALPLAIGVDGPLDTAYRLALDHVPLFAAMREQEKWLALAMIGYAVGLGYAVEGLRERSLVRGRTAPYGSPPPRRVGTRIAACAAVAAALLPLTSAPSAFWGLGGRVATSAYPSSWYTADELLGDGDEGILFLPWHGYQPMPFTDGRTVATVGGAFFRRPVLASDAVELPGLRTDSTSARAAYADRLVASAGGGRPLGPQLAPLGVRWVVLARGEEDERYAWLDDAGMTEVASAPELRVWDAGPAIDPRLSRTSPTSWAVAAGPPGRVVVPEEFSTGWQLDGRPGTATPQGTIAFDVDASAHEVGYAPWTALRWGVWCRSRRSSCSCSWACSSTATPSARSPRRCRVSRADGRVRLLGETGRRGPVAACRDLERRGRLGLPELVVTEQPQDGPREGGGVGRRDDEASALVVEHGAHAGDVGADDGQPDRQPLDEGHGGRRGGVVELEGPHADLRARQLGAEVGDCLRHDVDVGCDRAPGNAGQDLRELGAGQQQQTEPGVRDRPQHGREGVEERVEASDRLGAAGEEDGRRCPLPRARRVSPVAPVRSRWTTRRSPAADVAAPRPADPA